jgi:carbamoyltransferase
MHDSAAAVVVDGDVVCAVEEERLSRIKHTGAWPNAALEACLRSAGMRFREIDAVAFYWDPWLTVRSRLAPTLCNLPRAIVQPRNATQEADRPSVRGGVGTLLQMMRLRSHLRAQFGSDARRVPIAYVPHHLAHAASAFFSSPFERAAVWTIDGTGERDTSLLATGENNRIEVLETTPYPHSLGVLYGALTQYLGFRVATDEGKVMAMAAYGRPRYYDALRRLVEFRNDGTLRLDLRYFRFQLPGSPVWHSPRLADLLGPPRTRSESAVCERFVDIAASLQKLTQRVARHAAESLHARCPQQDLVIAGGVALNAATNGHLLEHSPFQRIFIPPAPGDAGCAPGAALFLNSRLGGARRVAMRHSFLGPEYSTNEIESALRSSGLPFERVPDISRRAARYLSEQKVVGWFQGRMEFGPRALGNRSILADPRDASMCDLVNEKVKFRETFRPLAPAILAERYHEYFEGASMSPFMLFLRHAKPIATERIPATLHVDNSARVQLVERSSNPRFHELLNCFAEVSGVPVLLNTSLNLAEEPIVCSPSDAIDTFLRSGLDVLAIGDHLVSKSGVSGPR